MGRMTEALRDAVRLFRNGRALHYILRNRDQTISVCCYLKQTGERVVTVELHGRQVRLTYREALALAADMPSGYFADALRENAAVCAGRTALASGQGGGT